MDPHFVRLDTRLDAIDDVLRGSADGSSVGLVEAVRRVSEEQARVGREIGELRNLPSDLAQIRRELSERDDVVRNLTIQTKKLAEAEERRATLREGEQQALDRVSKWLKIGAALLALVGVTGSSFGIALLRALSETVGALP